MKHHAVARNLTQHLLGQMARALGRLQDLVVKHGKVERKAQPDGVRGCQLGKGNILGGAVRCQCVLCSLLAFSMGLELGQISVVVTLHLEVKDLGFAGRCSGDQVVIQELEDAGADVLKLQFDL